MITRLNSTGTFYRFNGDYYSYDTQLTGYFAGEFWYNNTRYSVTTNKHQNELRNHWIDVDDLHTLNYCSYGDQDWSECIKYEIKAIKNELNLRYCKRRTEKNVNEIQRLLKKQLFLQSILDEVTNEV